MVDLDALTCCSKKRERKGRKEKAYLDSRLREHLVLFQDAVSVRFVGDLEEGDAFDGSHVWFLSCSELVLI